MQSPISSSRQDAARAPRPDRGRESALSLARFLLLLALLAWALRSFIVAPFSIPSGSMLPTLYIGDYLVVAKWPYGYSRYSFPLGIPSFQGRVFEGQPSRGDVVVFRHPGEDSDLIKRVIGVAGDTVELRGGQVILNGRPVPRHALPPYKLRISANTPCKAAPNATATIVQLGSGAFCLFPAFLETLPNGPSYTTLDQAALEADNFGPLQVPAGRVFLMGDNRDDSFDSRFPPAAGGIGMVPTENLIGRAAFTFWSTDGSASWWKPWTWFSAMRPARVGNGYTGNVE